MSQKDVKASLSDDQHNKLCFDTGERFGKMIETNNQEHRLVPYNPKPAKNGFEERMREAISQILQVIPHYELTSLLPDMATLGICIGKWQANTMSGLIRNSKVMCNDKFITQFVCHDNHPNCSTLFHHYIYDYPPSDGLFTMKDVLH